MVAKLLLDNQTEVLNAPKMPLPDKIVILLSAA
jgi:hypothetical protein